MWIIDFVLYVVDSFLCLNALNIFMSLSN